MQRLQATYEGLASSVPEARHTVEQTLAAWGLDELAWTAALLVSELAANVLLHAHTAFTVTLSAAATGGGVRLEVSDGSRRVPRTRRYGEQATTGRGLHLVDGLARSWGVQTSESGKTVWAELDRPADVPAHEDGDDGELDALLLAFPDPEDDAGPDRASTTARAA